MSDGAPSYKKSLSPNDAPFAFLCPARENPHPLRKKRFAFVECQRRISPLFLRLALPNGNRYAPGLVSAALSVRFAVFARRHCETATHLGARNFRMILCEAERRQYGVLSSEDRAKAPKRPVPRRCLSVFVRHRLTTVAATPTFNESRSRTAESALPSLNVSGVSAPCF